MEKLLLRSETEIITVDTSGEYEIVLDHVLKADITIKEHVKAVVLLKLIHVDHVDVHISVMENAHLRVLHQCEEAITLHENCDVYAYANVKSGFYVLDEKERNIIEKRYGLNGSKEYKQKDIVFEKRIVK